MSSSQPRWSADGNHIPSIDPHTKAKHLILEKYIENLVYTLYTKTRHGETQFTFIDGFCGGGMYEDTDSLGEWEGSPIRIIRAVREGHKKSKRTYREPLNIKFIFIDSKKNHLDCLKNYSLIKAGKAGCRLYVAVAPTPPSMTLDDFKRHLEKVMCFNPEVIFWEPINARGTNGKRMIAAGLEFTSSIMTRSSWAEYFKKQWDDIETAAYSIGCEHLLHIWPDPELKGYVDDTKLNSWLYKPTVEKWDGLTIAPIKSKSSHGARKN